MASRRGLLKLIGGGVVLAAAGAGGFIAANQPSATARAPWRTAGNETEIRRFALSYAILAPNPHNRQPWQVRLEGDESMTVFCDLDRRLPETDPVDRQITIGFGTFFELLSIAAAARGYGVEIDSFPEGAAQGTERLDGRPVAHVRFHDGAAAPDPLFGAILTRRTNRENFEAQDVPADVRAALIAAGTRPGVVASACGNDDTAAFLRDLTARAHEIEVTTARTNQESVDLMRFGAREAAADPDGIVFDDPLSAAGTLAGVLTRKALADASSSGFKQGLDIYRAKAASARAFEWLVTETNTRADQITAGRAYMRLTLEAARLGIAIHPWSQALQEYGEMRALYEDVHTRLAPGKTLQMLVRAGYASAVKPAPRWPMESHILA